MAYCEQCGTAMSDNANFCSNCGARRAQVPARIGCPRCGAPAEPGHSFCGQCGAPIGARQDSPAQGLAQPASAAASTPQRAPFVAQSQVAQPQPVQVRPQAQPTYAAGQVSALAVPANVVPRTKTGKRVIPTNRPFTHEELLAFMTERWNAAEYNQIITDPSLKKWTDLYVLLPATPRHMVIVYSRDSSSLFSKDNKVVVSYIINPAGAADFMVRAIPTHNAFFGAWKIAGNMSEKQDREGPTDDAMQRYADYLHFLLGQAGYLK